MSGDQIASLGYLALLALVIGGWHFVSQRQRMGQLLQHAAIWVFLFVGALVSVGLWMDIRNDIAPRQSSFMDGTVIEVPRAFDGHYYLTLEINGEPVRFVVDTGASDIVLSAETAEKVGIDADALFYTGRAFTANGMVQTAPVRLATVELAGLRETDIPAVVNGGELAENLLGMSYLRRFSRLEIARGTMILER